MFSQTRYMQKLSDVFNSNPPVFLFSLKKRIANYSGNIITVRRSSDNAEQNFGFIGDNLDTSGLLSFVGSGDGYVKNWYSQTNAIIATQTNAAFQGRIVENGNLVIEANGLPSIDFLGLNIDVRYTFTATFEGYVDLYGVMRVRNRDTLGLIPLWTNSSGYFGFQIWEVNDGNAFYYFSNGGISYRVTTPVFSDLHLFNLFGSSSNLGLGYNNNQTIVPKSISPMPNTPRVFVLGQYYLGSSWDIDGTIQEILAYSGTQEDKINIKNDINLNYNLWE